MSTEKKLFLPGPVPPALLAAARALRGEMTDAEQLLWQCLRRKQLGGSRFRRQHPVGRFVLDFYCCEARLAVELDGGQHNEVDVRAQDNERTECLRPKGSWCCASGTAKFLRILKGCCSASMKR